ncbi:helix-turn-helix domain-containing protein [Serratia symbiotica]|nr:helix-turn-helix domain-containing protein [Serratia symbiotica]
MRFNGQKKYSFECKQQVVHHYLNSDDGAKKQPGCLASTTVQSGAGLNTGTVNGVNDFTIPPRAYSTEFKESVVRWMQEHNPSSRKAATKFCIAVACTVSKWERLYREGGIIALRD